MDEVKNTNFPCLYDETEMFVEIRGLKFLKKWKLKMVRIVFFSSTLKKNVHILLDISKPV